MVVVGVLAAGGFLFARCQGGGGNQAVVEQRVETRRGTLEASVTTSGSVVMPHQAKLSFGASGGSTSVAGVVSAVLVNRGDVVTAGQALARLDDQDLQRALANAQADLRTAELNLYKLRTQYTEADVQNAAGAVRNAEVSLENVRRNLEVARNSTAVAQTVRQAHYEFNWYETDYGEALRLYEGGQISQSDLDVRRNNYYTAKERYETAQLNAATSLASAENDVKKAEETLAKAKEDLATKQRGADPVDLEMKTMAVTRARDALEQAKANLAAATLQAPFAGTIADIAAKVGERIASTGTVMQLVDTNQVRIDAQLDEVDSVKVKAGQEAKITFDALTGVALAAKVSSVSPVGVRSSGVVNYAVSLAINSLPPDLPLRESMTALATITTDKRENALLVPNRAVRVVSGRRIVMVATGPTISEARPVTVGMANDQFTEILSGLNDGDVVVVSASGSTTTSAGGGMPGGGVPGMMGR